MLMLNLIKLQHALGASIPNCVIYSKYTAEYMISTKSQNVPYFVFIFFSSFKWVFCLFGFFLYYRASCKTSAI